MFDAGRDKDRRARRNGPVFGSDADRRAAADDVIELVLTVRLLLVRLAGLQHVESRRHRGDANQLEIVVAGGTVPEQLPQLEIVHVRARNLTLALCACT